ncbi:MAG: hypothetical protein GY710_12270 [Desulfobacteraceae bacterium]|nr:hypothetical protein [Desulfobacteraceae bacterium]
MKIANVSHNFLLASLVAALFFVTAIKPAGAQEIKTIAMVPFTMNAAKDLSNIQKGILQMLYSRLSWQNHVLVIPNNKVKADLSKMDKITGNQLVGKLATATNSDYILTGSITNLAGSFSIDTKVYDIKNKRVMAFFEQSKVSDDLIDKVDRIAATINKKVFDRSTLTYEKIEGERQAHINKLKRQNPENLMNIPRYQKPESPGWKIWKYIL